MPYKDTINQIQMQFENIKDKVSNEGMMYLFAQFEVENLLKKAKQHYSLWKNIQFVDDSYLEEMFVLITQMKEFNDDLFDLMEMERNRTC